jgi:hypothetical protein
MKLQYRGIKKSMNTPQMQFLRKQKEALDEAYWTSI